MRPLRGLLLAAAVAGAGLALPAAAAPHSAGHGSGKPARYLVGAAVESINPTDDPAEPDPFGKADFYLGGYGLSSGKAGNVVEVLPIGRPATGVLGNGVHVRALAVGDGTHAIELAQIETQGYFAAYKQGPFGLVDIRRDAAAALGIDPGSILVDSNHSHGGPDTAGVWGGVPTAYLKFIHDQAVKALVEAYQRMRPAELVYGTAHAGVEGEQSRYPSPDPLLTNQFRNDPANQEVDDELRVLQARDRDTGAVLATYVNFSAHPTVLGGDNTLVTADYTGPLSDKLATLGGVGFEQVATLGRTQPARADCPDRSLTGAAADGCKLDAYAGRVFARVQEALADARPLRGKPQVALHSYLMEDAATNAPIFALGYAGYAVGSPIYRSVTPPWFTGNVLGAPSFSGRIGDLLISGGPGEMYPQIVAKVRATVPAAGYLNIGTAGDFLGYIVAPVEAYPEPIRRSVLSGDPPPAGGDCSGVSSPVGCPDPIGNDNYFFNVSHTFGERLTCSLLRGAGEIMAGDKAAYWSSYDRCPAFASDYVLPAGQDTQFPAQPDLSAVLTH